MELPPQPDVDKVSALARDSERLRQGHGGEDVIKYDNLKKRD